MREPVTAMPRPVRVEDLAEHIGVCRKTILRRIGRGEIAATKLGGQWLIPASEKARLSGLPAAA